MKKFVLFLFIAVVFLGCSTLTPEEKAYLDKAMKQPTTFTIPKNMQEVVLKRGKSFIEKFATVDLFVENDYLVDTHKPPQENVGDRSYKYKFGYRVELFPNDQGYKVEVECYNNCKYFNDWKSEHEHILAYYLATGEKPNPRLLITSDMSFNHFNPQVQLY